MYINHRLVKQVIEEKKVGSVLLEALCVTKSSCLWANSQKMEHMLPASKFSQSSPLTGGREIDGSYWAGKLGEKRTVEVGKKRWESRWNRQQTQQEHSLGDVWVWASKRMCMTIHGASLWFCFQSFASSVWVILLGTHRSCQSTIQLLCSLFTCSSISVSLFFCFLSILSFNSFLITLISFSCTCLSPLITVFWLCIFPVMRRGWFTLLWSCL